MKVFTWGLAVLMGMVLSGAVVAYAGAAEGTAGQKLFVKYRCQSCHSLKALKLEKKKPEAGEEEAAPAAAAGVAKKKEPPDLSGVGLERKPEWIEGWLFKKELIDGKKHRKKFLGTPAEAKTLAGWLATMKTKTEGGAK
jgi:hypothetical protein